MCPGSKSKTAGTAELPHVAHVAAQQVLKSSTHTPIIYISARLAIRKSVKEAAKAEALALLLRLAHCVLEIAKILLPQLHLQRRRKRCHCGAMHENMCHSISAAAHHSKQARLGCGPDTRLAHVDQHANTETAQQNRVILAETKYMASRSRE